jgi:hypothetical protein
LHIPSIGHLNAFGGGGERGFGGWMMDDMDAMDDVDLGTLGAKSGRFSLESE